MTDRFYIPTGNSALDAYRAFRDFAEKLAAAQGKKLPESWYEDGPEDKPELYRDVDTEKKDADAGPAE